VGFLLPTLLQGPPRGIRGSAQGGQGREDEENKARNISDGILVGIFE
jgi:hypothetical protein